MQIPPTVQLASIGIPDTLLLMLLALIVFGPRRLPEIGRQIGKLMYEFRKVSNDFKYQMEEELRASEEADRIKKQNAIAAQLPAQIPPAEPDFVAQSQSHPLVARVQEMAEGSTAPVAEAATSAEAGATEPPTETAPTLAEEPIQAELYRGEPRKFPNIQPPTTGEVIAAAKPYRNWVPETAPQPAVEAPVAAEATAEARAGTEHEANHG